MNGIFITILTLHSAIPEYSDVTGRWASALPEKKRKRSLHLL